MASCEWRVGSGKWVEAVGNRQMMWLPLHQWQQSANAIDKRGRGQIALNAMQMASSDNQMCSKHSRLHMPSHPPRHPYTQA